MALALDSLEGYRFPIRRGAGGYFDQAQSLDLVKQAIETVLGTIPGERVMQPRFGCDLDSLLFEPNDQILAVRAQHLITDALALWVPAVRIDGIDTTVSPASSDSDSTYSHVANYTVRYRLKSANSPILDVSGSFPVSR